ncbi:MFS transporter [Protaetiibacter sp. SSC-01]|uniref:MFS transporter n=1 Tax=Protaetiibacter sp. SSC-01 TaxID=2759943 RepID=UPI001656FD12|nr:MFS transporter [Protaetiibacter sp. SSC-01]QNO37872.1 MFS transporter [Protaetiibacter sp. SSC-01]
MTATMLRRSWIVALLLATGGVFAGWFGPIQILLPAQAARLAEGDGKEALLALVTAVGAVASILANPLWGLISDRMSLERPRRRPVVLMGLAIGVVGLVVLALASDPVVMIVGWVLVQVGLNGPFAALLAMIADRVPAQRRGFVGSMFGVAQVLGVVTGTAVAVALDESAIGYVALAVAVPLLLVAILLLPEPAARTEADAPDAAGADADAVAAVRHGIRDVLAALRPTAAFAWAWAIRLLANLVNALVLIYLYYFLADAVGVDDPGAWVLVVTLINVVVTVTGASIGGAWSDRIGRRKVFVVAAAVTLAAGCVVFALLPVLWAVLVAAVLISAGWALFVSVDVAIITQVLPSDRSTGSMLGVANVANALPQVIAPAIAAPIVTGLGGYPVMFLITAVISLLMLACLPRLRGVA